jgi:hypothetical protein
MDTVSLINLNISVEIYKFIYEQREPNKVSRIQSCSRPLLSHSVTISL